MKRLECKQRGVVLLLLLLVFLMAGSSIMLGALNNRQDLYVRQQVELSNQMLLAKEALLAFAANSSAIYYNARGPGFFPCPETMNPDVGIADATCSSSSVNLGRLPKYIEVLPDNKIFFNSYYAGVNQQFWYAIAPRYIYSATADDRQAISRTSVESTIASSRLTLDDTDNVVALIIAPGEALSFQDRNANPFAASSFLEGDNQDADSNFIATDTANPDAFNDRIIAITHNELMVYIGTNVAIEIKDLLDLDYDSQPEPKSYPGDPLQSADENQVEFAEVLAGHNWLGDTGPSNEQWASNTIYTVISATEASLQFAGCPVMSFTLKRDAGITRHEDSC